MKQLGIALGALLLAHPAWAADPLHPAVVELFQSQGCSSCPPANANILAIADRPDILVLTWEVTYWDYLGWRDSFGDRRFTARQYEYASGLGHDAVFTPQVVVNGRADTTGLSPAELAGLLRRADRGATGPSLTMTADRVSVGAGAGLADLVMVRYDPSLIRVEIRAGENNGHTLPHRNVVREIQRLGIWSGHATSFDLPPPARPGLRTAILLQAGKGGPILAACREADPVVPPRTSG
jgi:hypothetical protein